VRWRRERTSRTPPDYIDGLGVLDERREVRDLAFLAVAFDVPELRESAIAQTPTCSLSYPDVVVASCCCEAALAVGLEVGRVDGCVLVVPGHQKRSSPHGERIDVEAHRPFLRPGSAGSAVRGVRQGVAS
jgi:hypothetical protein